MGLEDELVAFPWSCATLDHSWDEKRAALEAGRAEASSRD